MSVWCKCRETECELTYLYNQPSCNFHFLRDHHYNVRHLLHKLNHCICESSTSIRGHMSLNTGSTLPKVARFRQQLKLLLRNIQCQLIFVVSSRIYQIEYSYFLFHIHISYIKLCSIFDQKGEIF